MFVLLIVSIVLFVDQLTKYIVVANFYLGESVEIVPKVLSFTYVRNTGTAFGLFNGYNWFFIIFTIIFILGLYFYRKKIILYSRDKYLAVCMSLLIGGALGNLIDRVFRSSVVDFIDFQVWPVFNIADSCISVSAVMLLIYLWKKDKKNEK